MAAQRDRDAEFAWRKSSASNEGATCVEVAVLESFVLVRDSHNKLGGTLQVVPERRCEFRNDVRREDSLKPRGLGDTPWPVPVKDRDMALVRADQAPRAPVTQGTCHGRPGRADEAGKFLLRERKGCRECAAGQLALSFSQVKQKTSQPLRT